MNKQQILIFAGPTLGLLVGYVLHGVVMDPVEMVVERTEEVARELSADELAAICAEPIEAERNSLATAQSKVQDLQQELEIRSRELEALKLQAKEDASRKEEAALAWRRVEAEIKRLETELEQAVEERDQLKEELKVTIQKLEYQIVETKKAKAEAEFFKSENTASLWGSFMAEAKVEICDRGSRKRHEKCHEAIESSLGAGVRSRFVECVNTYQSTPSLHQMEEKDGILPSHAIWLNSENKYTKKGWYIQYCDPTLPEAGGRPQPRRRDSPDELPSFDFLDD